MTDAPIADEVNAMTAGRDPHDPFAHEQAQLHDVRVEPAVPVGDAFPDAALLTATGESATLSDLISDRPAVVVFYRGAWCPYCNVALSVYRRELSGVLARRGVVLLAISPQKPDGSLTMQEKHDLDFPVLSDPGNRVASALGIVTQPSDEALGAQRENGLELTEVNADGSIALPVPTTAIVDDRGRLAWIDVHPDYSTRTEPAEILAALDRLALGTEQVR